MAKQEGNSNLRGKIGGIVYYKVDGEFLAKSAGSLDRKRVLKDPAFEGSRRAGTAFGNAAKASSLLRKAMGGMAKKLAESKLTARVNKVMLAVIASDATTQWKHEQRPERGNLGLLKGISWDREKPLSGVLTADYTVIIDRNNGVLELSLPRFAPKKSLKAPEGATHVELFAVGAALDFEKREARNDQAGSGVLALGGSTANALTLTCNVGVRSDLPLALGFGVMFFQEVNGEMAALKGGGSFEIVGVG